MNIGVHELELIAAVVPLAMGASFTPSLFALQILTTSGEKWRKNSLAFFLGSASAFFIACGALYFGFSALPHPQHNSHDLVGALIWFLAAAVLLGLTVWLFWPHGDLTQRAERELKSRIDAAGVRTFFIVAFVLSIKDVTSFALIVPALHETASADVGIIFQLLTALFVFALALFPVLLPPLWRTLFPANATRDLAVIYRFTMDNQFRIVGVIAAFFCLYCTTMGILTL